MLTLVACVIWVFRLQRLNEMFQSLKQIFESLLRFSNFPMYIWCFLQTRFFKNSWSILSPNDLTENFFQTFSRNLQTLIRMFKPKFWRVWQEFDSLWILNIKKGLWVIRPPASYPPLSLPSSYPALGPLPHKSFNQLNLLLGKVQSLWSCAHYFQ